MRSFFVLCTAVFLACGLYYLSYYPPVVLKSRTQQALGDMAAAVETKDRAKIGVALQELLADDARVHLDVTFFSLAGGNRPVAQDFDRASFIAFMDNVLYPLTDYGYAPELTGFSLADDQQSADVTIASREWGDGPSYYGGVSIDMRFSSDTTCNGQAIFADEKARIKNLTCALTLRTVPRPGQEGKMESSPEALREFLRQ